MVKKRYFLQKAFGTSNARMSWVCTVIVLTAILFGAGFLRFIFLLPQEETPPHQPADGIVVLTGGTQRIADALELLRVGYGKRLLISGVYARTSREELMKDNPSGEIYFSCCIDLDYLARNTIGNAITTRRWVLKNRFKSVIVVTSNYHMPRALNELRHVLPDIKWIPRAVVIDAKQGGDSFASFRLLFSEYVKYLGSLIRLSIENDPETSGMARWFGGRKPTYEHTSP
jgi:uncharacterized SAM-binding protein YcdF (DUF218 family)